MNHILFLVCLWGFLALPVILLSVRAARPTLLRWWLLLILLSVFGWLLVNGAVHFYYAYLDDLLLSYGDHVPNDLLQRRAADGAKLVFALFFGWAYGLVYLIPWLLIYSVVQASRRYFATRRVR
jgi:hypothetical protein